MSMHLDPIKAELLASYRELGGINHLDGVNLPAAFGDGGSEVGGNLPPGRAGLQRDAGFGHELPPIYGNHAWLRSIVRELIDNAIRHSKSRPMAGSNQKSQLEISARQMGPHVVLHIRNAGVGVLPKIADRVFLPFNTASASGRGWGESMMNTNTTTKSRGRGKRILVLGGALLLAGIGLGVYAWLAYGRKPTYDLHK